MKDGQVSVWVPIIVGVIGFLGVIAGQLINAWREQKREELRWKRESQRESMKLRHENVAQWRETRLSAYTTLLDSVNQVYSILKRGHVALTREESNTEFEEFRKALMRMREAESSVTLVGTKKLFAYMERDARLPDLVFILMFRRIGKERGGDLSQEERNHWTFALESIEDYRSRLVDILRDELGTNAAVSTEYG